jgi:hypothetical protein
MQNPVALEVQYGEYRRQAAWINENDWQFERPATRYPVRQAVAKALIGLATMLAPTTKQEARTA